MRLLCMMLLAVLAAGCSGEPAPPDDLLNEDTYIDLVVEMKMLQSYEKHLDPDSTAVDSLQRVIFQTYGTTEQQFRKSHRYYQQQAEAQRERIIQAIEQLRKDYIGARDTLRSGRPDSTRVTDGE